MKPETKTSEEKLQDLESLLREFFFDTTDLIGNDLNFVIDNITQDALFHIDKICSEDAGTTFLFMRKIKSLLSTLKPYANL